MNVVVLSAHRDSSRIVPRYMRQIAALRELLTNVRVGALEGDSTDCTGATLVHEAQRWALDLELIKMDQGTPRYGSTEQPARMAALSQLCNRLMESVRAEDDVVLYVECDLVWDAATAARLLLQARTRHEGFDIFAPLVMAGELFYDVWGYRDMDGARFGPFPPFQTHLNGKPMEVSSAGSCLAMSAAVARSSRINDGNALVGWCTDARRNGYKIAVDPRLKVRHL